jgi:hypothetical protein
MTVDSLGCHTHPSAVTVKSPRHPQLGTQLSHFTSGVLGVVSDTNISAYLYQYQYFVQIDIQR